jgi:nicotinamidase-related amidase
MERFLLLAFCWLVVFAALDCEFGPPRMQYCAGLRCFIKQEIAPFLTDRREISHDRNREACPTGAGHAQGRTLMKRYLIAALAAAFVAAIVLPAQANNVIDEWAKIQRPPAPALKPVTVDPKTTALLMLDFMNQNCGKRPRCVASIPAMKKLLSEARAHKVAVVYSFIAKTTGADVIKDVTPLADEPHVTSGPDKFMHTDLEKILKDRGIKTVIAVGTSANGAVLYTASGAALRGMNVIIPVDGMNSLDAYADLTTAWTFTNAPLVSKKTTLTRSDMVKF